MRRLTACLASAGQRLVREFERKPREKSCAILQLPLMVKRVTKDAQFFLDPQALERLILMGFIRPARFSLCWVLAIFVTPMAFGQVIFTETFDDPSSASKFQITSLGLDGANPPVATAADVYSEFGFDYSAMGGSRLTQSILTTTTGTPAGGGSTSGLLLAANLSTGTRSSINLYPIIAGMGLPVDPDTNLPVISDNYKMTFDFFAGVNGTGDLQTGGSGTSEYLHIGAQSDGDGQHLNGFGAALPDSDFFELNTNGDLSGSDLIPFTTRGGTPLLDTGGFVPNTFPALQAAFPGPQSATPGTFLGEDRWSDPTTATGAADGIPDGGAPAERWSTAEIRHEDGITTVAFNGVDVLTIEFSDFGNDSDNPDGAQAGLPWFGYTDFFGSVAGNDSPLVADAGGGGNPDGDYNDDGTVNMADYAVWRDALGSTTSLPNDPTAGVDAGDYATWKSQFNEVGGGSGSQFDPFNANYVIIDNVVIELLGTPAIQAATIPEPASHLMVVAGLVAVGMVRRRYRG